MKTLRFLILAVLALPLAAQTLPGVPAAPVSLDDRRKALNDLFHEYWDGYLKANPEFASIIGDKRWNDQIADFSIKAQNDWLEREQGWMLRLAAIDPAGLTAQETLSRDLLLRQFADDQEASEFKEW